MIFFSKDSNRIREVVKNLEDSGVTKSNIITALEHIEEVMAANLDMGRN